MRKYLAPVYVQSWFANVGASWLSADNSGSSCLGLSPGWGHCMGLVFLGMTLNSHSTSLHPGV